MKHAFILFLFLLIAAADFGCSQKAEETAEPAAENAAVESQIAAITDANVALSEGKRLLDENDTQSAIAAFRQAIKLNPDLADAHFNLGIAYSLLEMQVEQSGTVTEQPANDKDGKYKSNSEKAFGKAVEAYKKWIKANPKDDLAYFNLGRTYAKLTEDEDAEDAFEEAVKLKPDDTEYQTELGAIRIKLAKYHEAIEPLKTAIELDDGNVRAQDLLEDAEAGRKRVDYVPPKNTNQDSLKDSKANVNSNSNANTAQKTSETNIKPKKEEPKKTPERPK